ncbi:AMP-binding protein [Acidiphilium sp.]|uniref:AMP-binding protein n=1 Tax=Acidiphilium sp. TaxID=527 RepID=UPI003D058339
MGHPRTLQELRDGWRGHGKHPAIVAMSEDSVERLGYDELFDLSASLAAEISNRKFGGRPVIGIMMPNGIAWVGTFFGAVAAGGVVLPIDTQLGEDDLKRMIELAKCRLVFAGPQQAGKLRTLGGCEVVEIGGRSGTLHSNELTGPEWPRSGPDDVAVLAFTSGTTGQPKAVPLSHANLMSNFSALRHAAIIGTEDRAVVPLPLHHTYPMTVGMLTVLGTGACLILPAGVTGKDLVAAIRDEAGTVLLGVPRLYTVMMSGIEAEIGARSRVLARMLPRLLAVTALFGRSTGLPVGRYMFASLHKRIGGSLRLMVSGGAALGVTTETLLAGLGWQVLTGYGLTETSPILAFNRPGHVRVGSSGQALPGVSLRIAQPDSAGIGEIEAKGASVFGGYHDDVTATERAFTADGWFRTGDLGRLDAQGYLFIESRATETIVLANGKKISPEPLEKIYALDSIIREIAIMGREGRLVGLIVLNDDEVRRAGALRVEGLIRDVLNGRSRALAPHLHLSGFAVSHEPLPRTQLGKLRRHLLAELYEQASRHERTTGAEGAMSEQDRQLLDAPGAGVLLDWLRRRFPDQTVDLDSSPQLDLGIDSLGWTDLTLAMAREVGMTVSDRQIAEIMTVRDLVRMAHSDVTAGGALRANGSSGGDDRAARWQQPMGPGFRIVRAVGEVTVRVGMGSLFRLRVVGRELLPEPPFLICPNHISVLDPFAVGAALPHDRLAATYWMGWTGLLFSSRLRRGFSRAAQVLPIDPDRAPGAAIELGAKVLAEGRIVIWFPEGRLSPDQSLQPFQRGIAAVLERTPVPVVPAYISGTADVLAPGRWVPRLRPITVRFGKAIDATGRTFSGDVSNRRREMTEAIRGAVAALSAGE